MTLTITPNGTGSFIAADHSTKMLLEITAPGAVRVSTQAPDQQVVVDRVPFNITMTATLCHDGRSLYCIEDIRYVFANPGDHVYPRSSDAVKAVVCAAIKDLKVLFPAELGIAENRERAALLERAERLQELVDEADDSLESLNSESVRLSKEIGRTAKTLARHKQALEVTHQALAVLDAPGAQNPA